VPSTTGAKSLPCGSREGSKAPSVVVTLSTVIGRLPSVSVLVSVLSNELSKSVTELVGLRFGSSRVPWTFLMTSTRPA